ncbi:MAG: CdaR family protein [Dorea sp.]
MRKRIANNLALKILAFLIAAFLWLIVVNIDDPVGDKTFSNIPVQVVHEEVITDNNNTYQIVDNTQEVNVTVTAQRSVLDKIKAEDIQATADMKELTMRTQVPIEVTIKGYTGKYEKANANPRNLQIQIDEEAKNNFPITPTTTGTVREGYVVGELKALPEKVTLRGPKRIINSISKVTAEADVSGLSEDETLEAKLVLYDSNNNVIDQTLLANNLGKEGVSVEVNLLQVKRVPVKIDTAEISAAEGYKLGTITVEPQEVSVTGEKSVLSNVSEISIPASALQMENLTQRTETTVDISSYLPNDVSLAEENANKVVISIPVQQPGAKTFEVSTSSIVVNNLSSNLDISYDSTVDLEIQIKGPSDVLNVFSPAKKVSIDLKEYTEPGTYIVPVSVELPDGCSLVNDVSVEIVLEKRKQSSKTQDDVYDNSQKQSSDQNQTNDSDQNTSDATTDKKQGE